MQNVDSKKDSSKQTDLQTFIDINMSLQEVVSFYKTAWSFLFWLIASNSHVLDNVILKLYIVCHNETII